MSKTKENVIMQSWALYMQRLLRDVIKRSSLPRAKLLKKLKLKAAEFDDLMDDYLTPSISLDRATELLLRMGVSFNTEQTIKKGSKDGQIAAVKFIVRPITPLT